MSRDEAVVLGAFRLRIDLNSFVKLTKTFVIARVLFLLALIFTETLDSNSFFVNSHFAETARTLEAVTL